MAMEKLGPQPGNIVGSVLSGDVFNRYCKLRNYETLFIGGTDEYGTATETKALEENKTPLEVCDHYHVIHRAVYDWFNIKFDEFGRTTNPLQTPIAQEIFTKIEENNYLFQDTIEQLFCSACERFLADRFVEGICPHCQFEDARGDQCDGCSKLINAIDLKEPKCKLCRATPIVRQSTHFFFDLRKSQDKLKAWYLDVVARSAPPPKPLQSAIGGETKAELESDSQKQPTTGDVIDAADSPPVSPSNNQLKRNHLCPSDTHWTNTAKAITESWFRGEGLKPRCITRDMKWGTKVPFVGCEDKVFYVWFDAPIGYLSISACHTKNWQDWWKGDNVDIVEYYQFMAKDNVPFHSIMFPATLLATGENWVKPKGIIATDYLNYEGTKFSKSRGTGVFGNDAKDTGLPADIWRFYLMYIRPEGQDSSFSWDDFREKCNNELLNNLGNFINRAISFTDKNFNGLIEHYEPNEEDEKYLDEVGQNLIAYEERLERVHLRDGIKPILAISRLGNQLIQSNKPWLLIKSESDIDKKRAQTVMHLAVNTAAILSLLLEPYMPDISSQIKKQLAFDTEHLIEFSDTMPLLLNVGHKIGQPALLFKRIEQDQINEFKKRYGCAADDKKEKAKSKNKSKSNAKGAASKGNQKKDILLA